MCDQGRGGRVVIDCSYYSPQSVISDGVFEDFFFRKIHKKSQLGGGERM